MARALTEALKTGDVWVLLAGPAAGPAPCEVSPRSDAGRETPSFDTASSEVDSNDSDVSEGPPSAATTPALPEAEQPNPMTPSPDDIEQPNPTVDQQAPLCSCSNAPWEMKQDGTQRITLTIRCKVCERLRYRSCRECHDLSKHAFQGTREGPLWEPDRLFSYDPKTGHRHLEPNEPLTEQYVPSMLRSLGLEHH